MSAREYLASAARRVRAIAALETASGGTDEATQVMEAVAAYYEHGGTWDRLQASLIADIEAGGPEQDSCEDCGDPNCTGSQPVPLREGFLNMGVALSVDQIEWTSYPLVESMPDDAELAADDFDKQLPTHLVRISDVLVRQYHDNGQPTGRWFGAAAVTEVTNLS